MQDNIKKLKCHNCKEKFDKEELIQATKSKRLCQNCNEIRNKNKNKKVQCGNCKEEFYKEELIQVTKSRRLCQSCKEIRDKGNKVQCDICREKFYKEELIQVSTYKKVCQHCNETEQAVINQRKELIDFICQCFGLEAPTGQQLARIKEYKELGYSYFEIHYTLYYLYFVLDKKIEGTSIDLFPYYYEKAKEHHRLVENAKKTAKKIEIEEITIERKAEAFKPKIKNTRLINIEKII